MEKIFGIFGECMGWYFNTAFNNTPFILSILVWYTLIYHSNWLREKKILEYTGLGLTAASITALMFVGLYAIVS